MAYRIGNCIAHYIAISITNLFVHLLPPWDALWSLLGQTLQQKTLLQQSITFNSSSHWR